MKKEIKDTIQQIRDECLIDLPPDTRKRITKTDEVRLSDVLWMARNEGRRETQSKLLFSEGMKSIVVSWDLENDDLKKQHDSTILMIRDYLNIQP